VCLALQPWCGFCKKLNPVLDAVAPRVAGQMRVGKVDATVEKKLAKQHNADQAYPTIKFRRDGTATLFDYDGPRTEEAFVAFAARMNREWLLPAAGMT
jgi:thiol-disulfide isomerase/thioredoxin